MNTTMSTLAASPGSSLLVILLGIGLLGLVLAYALLARRANRRAADRTPTSQAKAVDAWTDGILEVLVANRSSRPVHDVRAFVTFGRRRPRCVGWIKTLPPTGNEAAKVALTAEGRERWIVWQGRPRNRGRDVEVECTFRDDAGQQWRRRSSGDVVALRG